jgi:hypothetical protein
VARIAVDRREAKLEAMFTPEQQEGIRELGNNSWLVAT